MSNNQIYIEAMNNLFYKSINKHFKLLIKLYSAIIFISMVSEYLTVYLISHTLCIKLSPK